MSDDVYALLLSCHYRTCTGTVRSCPDWHGTVARLRVHRLLSALRAFTASLSRLHRAWRAVGRDSKGPGLALQQDCIMTDIFALPRDSLIAGKHTLIRTHLCGGNLCASDGARLRAPVTSTSGAEACLFLCEKTLMSKYGRCTGVHACHRAAIVDKCCCSCCHSRAVAALANTVSRGDQCW